MSVPGRRHEVAAGVLGVDPELDRVPADRRIAVAQRLALGDAEHLPHQVQPGDLLRDRVLHLEPGVHLEEADGAVLTDQELARAGSDVARLGQDRLRGGVQPLLLLDRQERGRRLLDQLLVPPLQRTVPGRDDHHVAVRVGQALSLHVPRPVQVPLDEALAATERRHGLTGRRLEERRDLVQGAGHLEPAAAAAERRLDRDRQAVLRRKGHHRVGVGYRVRGARHQRCTDLLGDVPGLDLVAQRVDRRGRRPDPDQSGVDHRGREARVLGQEAVAGMDRVGPAAPGDVDDLVDVQVGLGGSTAAQRVRLAGQPDEQCVGIRLGVDGNAAQPGIGGRPDHADRNLSPIGDQHLCDAHGRHSSDAFCRCGGFKGGRPPLLHSGT